MFLNVFFLNMFLNVFFFYALCNQQVQHEKHLQHYRSQSWRREITNSSSDYHLLSFKILPNFCWLKLTWQQKPGTLFPTLKCIFFPSGGTGGYWLIKLEHVQTMGFISRFQVFGRPTCPWARAFCGRPRPLAPWTRDMAPGFGRLGIGGDTPKWWFRRI